MYMAKRYLVKSQHELNNPNDPSDRVLNVMVDLPLLLSQRLGRMVRQGRSIRLHSVTASVRPATGMLDDADLGMAVVGHVEHCPANKHSVRAWQDMFKVWTKQKQLKLGAMGRTTRHDDFEIGWNTDIKSTRTSEIYQAGFEDNDPEPVVLYGESTEGSLITSSVATLQDYYNGMQSSAHNATSKFAWNNQIVKTAKYNTVFPLAIQTPFACHMSATDNPDSSGDSGATASISTVHNSDSATLGGVLNVEAWALQEDDFVFDADTFVLTLTYEVSLGASLVQRKSKPKKKITKRRARSRSRSRKRS
tara:strand:- start:1042 stop:1959 length:918 start_codon:yes stop_codon:yes gene_type:complete